MLEVLVTGFVALITAAVGYRILFTRVVVHEFEAGLLYRNGQFKRRLAAGAYRVFKSRSEITVVDLRRRLAVVAGQEVLSSDNVGLKVSVTAVFEIASPEKAAHSVQDYNQALHAAIQLGLRSAVGASKIDELLEQRLEIGKKLMASVAPEADALGLKLHSVELRDVMFPGELKKIFAEVVRAQKEGQAALERARGETAALRNLANAAKMLEDNPALMNLRALQSMTAGSSGNTFVLGLPGTFVPLDKKPSSAAPGAKE